ncbi:Aldolase-type TIM barrel, partial [Penicillium argentinense]
MLTLLIVTLALLPAVNALVREDGVGRLPALGWNAWNAFGCDVDSQKIMSAANQMVSLGLKDLGYEYVSIDDCWSIKNTRNASITHIIPDPSKFPDGNSGVASQVHELGLKIGIYSSAGETTCAGYPASLGYEKVDAEVFAEWGIDYAAPEDYDWTKSKTYTRYMNMRDALLGVNRTIFYSLCDWGQADVNTWANGTANWARISEIANENTFKMNCVGFWGHPDSDMLELGNGNLTASENRAHFALWAIMRSPLIIEIVLNNISDSNLAILKSKQDPVIGRPAIRISGDTTPIGPLTLITPPSTGRDETASRTAVWNEIPELDSDSYQVIDGWTGKNLGCVKNQYTTSLSRHDVALLVVK